MKKMNKVVSDRGAAFCLAGMMRNARIFLCMLAVLACVGCAGGENTSADDALLAGDTPPADDKPTKDTPPADDDLLLPYQFIPKGEDRDFECRAGDYDSNSDGVLDFSIDCWPNGNRKSVRLYQAYFNLFNLFSSSQDDLRVSHEYTFYKSNGNRKTSISYRADGVTKDEESTYYESNGNRKTTISYRADGVTKDEESTYYESNGNRKTTISYRADGVTKSYEQTHYESNGNRKTTISYQADGVTKFAESTYYENGYRKTSISYYSNGTPRYHDSKCYEDDGRTEESCTLEKHGCHQWRSNDGYNHYSCDQSSLGGGRTDCIAGDYDINNDTKTDLSTTCYNNGNRKTFIFYGSDGRKSDEYTYYESNGNPKKWIYYSRGSKYLEYTYYENGNYKTYIGYHRNNGNRVPDCYGYDGRTTEESCTLEKHGCPKPKHWYDDVSCDQSSLGGGRTDCIAGDYDINNDTKTDLSITCHDNGNRKTFILYQYDYQNDSVKKEYEYAYYESSAQKKTYVLYYGDGVTKKEESTYYESNGNRRTWILYYESDGRKRSSDPACYEDDGITTELCTVAKHGCDITSETCIQ